MIDPIADGMAIIYVYRPTQDFGDWQSQSVYVNGRKIASLSSPAYTLYMTLPGMVNVKLLGLREAYLRFEVGAGKSYFVKTSLKETLSPFKKDGIDVITLMDDQTGLQEIRGCKLSSDISVK
jgi:hypothetical protein